MLSNDDPYWQDHRELFMATIPRFGPEQTVWGRTHVQEERSRDGVFRTYPLPTKGTRVYACLTPYLHEVLYTTTIALYPRPRGTAIGETVTPAEASEMQTVKLGNAFAYVFPQVQTIAIWEAYLYGHYRQGALPQDGGMRGLWTAFERWLLAQWPETTLLLTHDHDIDMPDQYQALLAVQGFGPWTPGVWGKRV